MYYYLVAQVEVVLFRYVSEQVHDSVQVSDRHDLAADVIVEPVDSVRVDEAVAHPQARLDTLLHLTEQVERRLNKSRNQSHILCKMHNKLANWHNFQIKL